MSDFYMSLFEPRSMSRNLSLFLVDNQNLNEHKKMESQYEKEKQKVKNDDLYNSFRIFLRFGRIIGVTPISGLMGGKSENLRFRMGSFPALFSFIIILILCVNLLVGIITFFLAKKKTASEVAFASAMAIFYGTGLFVYCYFLIYADKFIQLFQKWRNMKKLYFDDKNGDHELFLNVNIVSAMVFTSAFFENILLFLLQSRLIPSSLQEVNYTGTLWEVYYMNSHSEWYQLFSEKQGAEYLGIFVFLSNKLALYSWNFADILTILLSRALYFKFKKLNIIAEERLIFENVGTKDGEEWKHLTYDHNTLCDLLNEFENFLTPLVFGLYTSNIFFICLQIKMGVSPSEESNTALALYTVWSFLHLIFRVFLVSVSAARINDHAHATRILLQLCPSDAYSLEVQRAEHRLGTSMIGLTGLRCFIITKPFLLTIVGVIFTIEIVMLQSQTV